MRVRLKLNSDRREAAIKELEALGIEISEEADLILTDRWEKKSLYIQKIIRI